MVISALVQASAMEVWFKSLFIEEEREVQRGQELTKSPTKAGVSLGQSSGLQTLDQGSAWQPVWREQGVGPSLLCTATLVLLGASPQCDQLDGLWPGCGSMEVGVERVKGRQSIGAGEREAQR